MKHYLYQVHNTITDMIYIGIHSTPMNYLDTDYYGSGNRIVRAVKKYGKSNFVRTVLVECESREAVAEYESIVVDDVFINRDDTYNLVLGGGSPPLSYGDEHHTRKKGVSAETRSKQSKAKIGKATWNKGLTNLPPTWNSGMTLEGDHRDNVVNAAMINLKKAIAVAGEFVVCPHCGKEGKQSGMKSWHFEYCKSNPERKIRTPRNGRKNSKRRAG